MIIVYPGALASQMEELSDALEGFEYKLCGDESLELPMRDLVENEDLHIEIPCTKDPFFYFVGEDPKKIGKLQSLLEERKLPVHAMAIETDNNKNWKLKDIMAEVGQEADYFKKRDQLASLIEHADIARMLKDEVYGESVFFARYLLNKDDLDEKTLDLAIKALSE